MALAFDVNIVVVEATHSTAQKTLRIEFAFGNTPTLVNTPPKWSGAIGKHSSYQE